MTHHTKVNKIFLTMLVSFALITALSGCGRYAKDREGDARVVARINNYELTVKDFKDEAFLASVPDPESPSASLETKKELLKNVILKKLLLQEAQKQNFDKDKAFMREIERYWEQALLKLLIKEKTKEFARDIKVEEDEKDDIYHEKMQELFNEWTIGLRENATVEINTKVLEEVKLEKEN